MHAACMQYVHMCIHVCARVHTTPARTGQKITPEGNRAHSTLRACRALHCKCTTFQVPRNPPPLAPRTGLKITPRGPLRPHDGGKLSHTCARSPGARGPRHAAPHWRPLRPALAYAAGGLTHPCSTARPVPIRHCTIGSHSTLRPAPLSTPVHSLLILAMLITCLCLTHARGHTPGCPCPPRRPSPILLWVTGTMMMKSY